MIRILESNLCIFEAKLLEAYCFEIETSKIIKYININSLKLIINKNIYFSHDSVNVNVPVPQPWE